MDLNTILRFLVTISCLSLILRVLMSRRNWGWLGVASSILGIMVTAFVFFPEQSGIVGGILWLTFVLIPILGLRQVNHFVYQESFHKARRLASILSWLHPGDGWRDQPQFLYTLELIKKGDLARAQAILNQHFKGSHYGFNYTAQALQFRIEARWEECLNWLESDLSEAEIWQNSTLVSVYLRALGEVGKINRLIWLVQSHNTQLYYLGDSIPINLARLYVFAFTGEIKAVQKLFQFPLNVYPKKVQQFWLATAQLAAGNQEFGKNILYNIREKEIDLAIAISYRLSHSFPEASTVLSSESRQIINRIKQELQQEINYGGAVSLTPKKANLTYSLMVLNILVFIVEIIQGGSENLEVLYYLGAAVPEAIFSGELWRVVTANFLHFGYVHLASNLLGLWILGPYVEFYLGWIRYFVIYTISGVGAIYLFADLAILTGRGDDILVGASAAIMGLMGATFMILWRGWQQEQSKIAKERLRLVMLIIGLQVIFDLTLVNVSFLGHAFGLILGALSTSVILVFRREKARL